MTATRGESQCQPPSGSPALLDKQPFEQIGGSNEAAMLAGFLRVGLGYVWIGQKNGVDS